MDFRALILFLLIFSACTNPAQVQDSFSNTPAHETVVESSSETVTSASSTSLTMDPKLERASPYLAPIITSDPKLTDSAQAITKKCTKDDTDCKVFYLYRYVVENYAYLSDPKGIEKIRTVPETIRNGGGDCEDLSILLNSYLEQLDVSTYLVLSDDHAYTLACGVNTTHLSEFVQKQFVDQLTEQLGADQPFEVYEHGNRIYLKDKSENRAFTMKPGEVLYYGGDGSEFDEPFELLDLSFTLTARYPVQVYVVPSKDDFRKFSEGKPFSHYPECLAENVTYEKDSCKGLGKAGGLMLVNPTAQPNNVQFQTEFSYLLSQTLLSDLLAKQKMAYYSINKENCIVLDPTGGYYGYPGYDGNVTGEKYAVNVRTKEIVNLK